VISLSTLGLVVDNMNNLAFPQRHEAEYKAASGMQPAVHERVTPVMAAVAAVVVGQFALARVGRAMTRECVRPVI
jgi:hypothetical protein